MKPDEAIIYLRLPDLPGVKAVLDIEAIGDMEVVEFLRKLLGIVVVWLVFGGRADIHVETPGRLI